MNIRCCYFMCRVLLWWVSSVYSTVLLMLRVVTHTSHYNRKSTSLQSTRYKMLYEREIAYCLFTHDAILFVYRGCEYAQRRRENTRVRCRRNERSARHAMSTCRHCRAPRKCATHEMRRKYDDERVPRCAALLAKCSSALKSRQIEPNIKCASRWVASVRYKQMSRCKNGRGARRKAQQNAQCYVCFNFIYVEVRFGWCAWDIRDEYLSRWYTMKRFA